MEMVQQQQQQLQSCTRGSHVYTDREAEFILNVTLERKVINKMQENTSDSSRLQCSFTSNWTHVKKSYAQNV